jgi:hypothetical protein
MRVPATITLSSLHDVLQIAVGWEGDHLHKFLDHWGDELDEDYELDLYGSVTYLYDLGDRWFHTITVEKKLTAPEDAAHPRCLAGRRSGPMEDSGGPVGYAELVRQIKARRGPRYRELRAAYATVFDPERFDLAAINAELAGLLIRHHVYSEAEEQAKLAAARRRL